MSKESINAEIIEEEPVEPFWKKNLGWFIFIAVVAVILIIAYIFRV